MNSPKRSTQSLGCASPARTKLFPNIPKNRLDKPLPPWYTTHMENEIELYERHDDYPQADPYFPGGMARERYYDRDDYEEEEEPEEDFGYFGEDGLWD
jgi:hypothetical protein